jgi:hypothetical protein
MMSTVKILAALTLVCVAVFGLLFAFGVVTIESVTANSIQILGGASVLIITVVALKAISGRGVSKTDPPPQL